MLTQDPTRQALSPNERAHLKMVLADGYVVPWQDITGRNKPKKEWKLEVTKAWRAKQRWSLNAQDQVVRNAEGEFEERIAACTYNASKCIDEVHHEVGHGGIQKTFILLQEGVRYSL